MAINMSLENLQVKGRLALFINSLKSYLDFALAKLRETLLLEHCGPRNVMIDIKTGFGHCM